MRFFAFITLFSAFLLFWTKPFDPNRRLPKKPLPGLIKEHHRSFKARFESPQNANVLWAFLTGEKSGISPSAKKSFTTLELNFLFSPSGLHLSAFLAIFFTFLKKHRRHKGLKTFQWIFLIAAYFLPYLAIKRIVCLRLLILLQRLIKLKVPIEINFLFTFSISFLLGHFQESPLSFIMSFLFMGSFIALSKYSRLTMILGLFSNHLLICLFSGADVSLLSLLINIPLIAAFTFLLPFFYFYFLSFHWIHFNWIEWIVRAYIVTVHWCAKLTIGTSVSATLFMMLAVWIILLKKPKRYLLIVLLLHGNTANSPAFFSGSYSGVPRAFEGKSLYCSVSPTSQKFV